MTEARFALALAPIPASSAVTHVPMLMPSVANSAASSVIRPEPAIVINIPVVADELCIAAVSASPMKNSAKGLLIFMSALLTAGISLSMPIASDISISPENIMPKPSIIMAAFLTLMFLHMERKKPTPVSATKNSVMGRNLSATI